MGLFSRKKAEPVVHPAIVRTIYVAADEAAVVERLAAYSSLTSPRHAPEQPVGIATVNGWTAVRLPDLVHPWQLHNLAFWLLDCPGVNGRLVATSAASDGHPAYALVRDPQIDGALCGWDEAGGGWTVDVPTNRIARPDPPPVPSPIARPGGFESWRSVGVRFEDPGREQNPRLEAEFRSRKQLVEAPRAIHVAFQ